MKGHKAHHHRGHKKDGGPMVGVKEWEQDKAPKEVYAGKGSHVEHEAEEKKHGGRTKRKHGGHVMHHHSGHVKHVGAIHGEGAKHHAGRKARKMGGKVGADSHPLSSAHKGTHPKGHKDVEKD